MSHSEISRHSVTLSATSSQSTSSQVTGAVATRPTRRAYESPRILHRQSLEAMAADCGFPGGKGDPTCSVGFS